MLQDPESLGKIRKQMKDGVKSETSFQDVDVVVYGCKHGYSDGGVRRRRWRYADTHGYPDKCPHAHYHACTHITDSHRKPASNGDASTYHCPSAHNGALADGGCNPHSFAVIPSAGRG